MTNSDNITGNSTGTLHYLDLSHPTSEPVVTLGVENLLDGEFDLIRGRRVGLITNPTGVDSRLKPTIVRLHECSGCELKALFSPEHGLWGRLAAGVHIKTSIDPVTHLPVYSLYGDTRKPRREWLADLDALVFDIQDIGNRSYTFLYTMAMAMEASRDAGIPFILCDRPNPLGGVLLDGNVLDPQRTRTYVGMYPIPYIYGMTIGELGRLINAEFGIGADLRVVQMSGWKRDMMWWNTGLRWIPTSPNVPRPETTFHVAMTGFLGEMQTVCEGVGTTLPFEILGAPWMDAFDLAEALNDLDLPGLMFRPLYFKPRFGTFMNQDCAGVQIHIIDYRRVKPLSAGLHLVATVMTLWPERHILGQTGNTVRIKMFNAVMGTDAIRQDLLAGRPAEEIIAGWRAPLDDFRRLRERYLLYP
ncbi:MAG: DUF1343 domain-containing protein [Candidatus Sumerlaeia bacterium]